MAGADPLAKGLGLFSIGLGLSQLLAPRGLARTIGVRDDDETRKTMLALGLREIASGVAILMQRRPAPGLWSRVAGDMMDLALLGKELNAPGRERNRITAATAAVAGVTLLDAVAAVRSTRSTGAAAQARAERGIHVKKSITVNRPAAEVYAFWHDFTNLPAFMVHLESVEVTGGGRSRWRAKAPAGMTVEWEAETVDDVPNERISWRSVEGADVPNEGTVRFVPAPGGRGTEVRVELRYAPPGGRLGAAVAKLFGEEPAVQIDGDLRRFKQVLETGEIVHSDASVHRGAHPARPPASGELTTANGHPIGGRQATL